jgi:hypothetical protein
MRREGMGESHERESMIKGRGCIYELRYRSRGRRGFNHRWKESRREGWGNLMREKA